MAFDCQKCGACCGQIVALMPDDKVPHFLTEAMDDSKLPLELIAWNNIKGVKKQMRVFGKEKICIAFRGSIGKECSCSIYENRPLVCKAFASGSEQCLLLRKFHNIAL